MVITGKIQGVFFRDFVKQNANKLGVVGCVKNLRNGGLELIAQGMSNKVDELVKLCRCGLMLAKVDCVELTDMHIESEREYTFFDIRPG